MAKEQYTAFCKDRYNNMIQISGMYESRDELKKIVEENYPRLGLITVVSEKNIVKIKETLG